MLIDGPAYETNYEPKHIWQPAPQKRASSRRFPPGGPDSSPDDDCLLEERGFEPPVPRERATGRQTASPSMGA
jgi:hypothetical protein